MTFRYLFSFVGLLTSAVVQSALAQSTGTVNLPTYHYDNYRTGWNRHETILKPGNVNAKEFGVLAQVSLDGQVDAQPLVVNNIVYVVTSNDTVYALNGATGAVLNSNHLGTPVPTSTLPGKCQNGANMVGITSTPVIDVRAGAMYLVTYTYENRAPVYRIHQLSIPSLAEVNNVVITASHVLSDGVTDFTFDPQFERQRPALLEANGNIYAGFGSFCDLERAHSRGMVLGWQAGTLTPLPNNELTDQETKAQTEGYVGRENFTNFFLSSIWMNGYGIAADASGNLFFATGNSGTVRANNLQESAVKLSPDLTTVEDYFTPYKFQTWDEQEEDFGAGGVLVAPVQPGPIPHLAIVAGKSGAMYMINRQRMGHYVAGGPDAPPSIQLQPCWCGPSYFVGSDEIGRVVASAGNTVNTFTINTANNPPLTPEGVSEPLKSGQNPGFFTSISSDETKAATAIIWAVGRPTGGSSTPTLTLYAFNATPSPATKDLAQLYTSPAGPWIFGGGNANAVPVVANGYVYVASYKQLTIFGPLSAQLPAAESSAAAPQSPSTNGDTGPRLFGTVTAVDGNMIRVLTRTGKTVTVDLTEASNAFLSVLPLVGGNVEVRGEVGPNGSLIATSMVRAKEQWTWDDDVP